MKKWSAILTLILVLCMVLTMVGCGDKEPDASKEPSSPSSVTKTAYDMIYQAFEKQAGAVDTNGIDLEANLKLTMEAADGSSTTFPITLKIQCVEGDAPAMNMTVNGSLMGMSLDMHILYADGWAYYEMMGEKFKMNIPFDELMKNAGVGEDLPDTSEIDLTEEDAKKMAEKLLANAKTETVDGNTVISHQLSANEMNEALADYMELLSGLFSDTSAPVSSDSLPISFGDTSFSFTLNPQGVVTAMAMKLPISMTSDLMGETTQMTVTLELDMTIQNAGEKVTVTPPSDPDSYPDGTGMGDLSQEDAAYIAAMLVDADGNLVENFADVYATLCDVYGQTTIDAVLESLFQDSSL